MRLRFIRKKWVGVVTDDKGEVTGDVYQSELGGGYTVKDMKTGEETFYADPDDRN